MDILTRFVTSKTWTCTTLSLFKYRSRFLLLFIVAVTIDVSVSFRGCFNNKQSVSPFRRNDDDRLQQDVNFKPSLRSPVSSLSLVPSMYMGCPQRFQSSQDTHSRGSCISDRPHKSIRNTLLRLSKKTNSEQPSKMNKTNGNHNRRPRRKQASGSLNSSNTSSNRKTTVLSSSCDEKNQKAPSTFLWRWMKSNGYHQRLCTLSTDQLPLVAEILNNERVDIVLIVQFILPSENSSDNSDRKSTQSGSGAKEPKVMVIPLKGLDGSESSTLKTKVIDIGQITTIWTDTSMPVSVPFYPNSVGPFVNCWLHYYKSILKMDQVDKVLDCLSNDSIENSLDRMYRSYVGRSRNLQSPSASASSMNDSLSKRQLESIVQANKTCWANNCLNDTEQTTAAVAVTNVLRKVTKGGTGFSRIIDSSLHQSYLFPRFANKNTTAYSFNEHLMEKDNLISRAVSANILGRDAKSGGRFKRWPCTFISFFSTSTNFFSTVITTNTTITTTTSSTTTTETTMDTLFSRPIVVSINLVNGGWIVLDQSIRASAEARKFTERLAVTYHEPSSTETSTSGTTSFNTSESGRLKQRSQQAQTSITTTTTSSPTYADERISRRLECLAMGELMYQEPSLKTFGNSSIYSEVSNTSAKPHSKLELDVREVLHRMSLPITPAGAKEALIRTGYWSSTKIKINNNQRPNTTMAIQPWSKDILAAAAWYAAIEKDRCASLASSQIEGNNINTRNLNKNHRFNGNEPYIIKKDKDRIDLTHLPCIAIDNSGTTFRDDAISLRQRITTGRQLLKTNGRVYGVAPSWELLIHIADVSDIYANHDQFDHPPSWTNETKALKMDDYDSAILSHSDIDAFNNLALLRQAAESRGASRYDLPRGPLHLLPPIVSEALSLSSQKQFNRCVTIWIYMDDKTGEVLDAGIERTIVSSPIQLSYEKASDLMNTTGPSDVEDAVARAFLMICEDMLSRWSEREFLSNIDARKREARLSARDKQMLKREKNIPKTTSLAYSLIREVLDDDRFPKDNNNDRLFERTRAHRLVDSALDMYSMIATDLLQKKRAPIPCVPGFNNRRPRLATAPLRRYIDGIAQLQLLSVLCNYGGPALTLQQCKMAGKRANDAINSIRNIRAQKK